MKSPGMAGAFSYPRVARRYWRTRASVVRCDLRQAAVGIDIQAATAYVARVDAERLRLQQALQVEEDAFDALFVEVLVLAEGNQVGQQAGRVQRRAPVVDHQGAPVGLAGDRAVGLEQVAVELLLDDPPGVAAQQFRARLLVAVDGDVQLVDAAPRQTPDALLGNLVEAAQAHAHGRPGSGREVFLQYRAKRLATIEGGLVEGIEVKLERLRLDDVRRVRRDRELADRHHRLAGRGQPGQLVAVPDIHAAIRQGLGAQAKLGPFRRA